MGILRFRERFLEKFFCFLGRVVCGGRGFSAEVFVGLGEGWGRDY